MYNGIYRCERLKLSIKKNITVNYRLYNLQ